MTTTTLSNVSRQRGQETLETTGRDRKDIQFDRHSFVDVSSFDALSALWYFEDM